VKEKILGSRYKVLKYIAKGGFGTTYLAEDTQLPGKDLCVVKQLSPGSQAPNMLNIARRLFKNEAATLHNLGHHDRIPELLAYFEEEEKFYLVQQYINGQTVEQELNSEVIWSEVKVIALLLDSLEILEYIHTQGVIHRDIKPANLIRRHQDHKIVLVDFGTVKNMLQEQTKTDQLTIAVGTQGYMPVEQARGKPYHTSDIYALGIIGIEALTRVEPLKLEEDDDGELIWSHLADVSSPLAEILTTMTRCRHTDRYQSAQEARQALTALTNAIVTTPTIPVVPKTNKSLSPNIGTVSLTTFATSAISDPQPIATSTFTGNDLHHKSSPNQTSSIVEDISAGTFNLTSSTVSSKSRGKGIWAVAIAFGAVVIGGAYFLIQQSILQPQLDTAPPEIPNSSSPRMKQGEGFRKNL
jgi:serine/threonine protein kinase